MYLELLFASYECKIFFVKFLLKINFFAVELDRNMEKEPPQFLHVMIKPFSRLMNQY